jgi:hypothetical protein
MKTDRPELHQTDGPAPTRGGTALRGNIARGLSNTIRAASTAATALVERLPGSVDTVRAGASDTTTALQVLPDPTLRWLAATSVGLGAGFYFAGVPRVMIAAAVAPAILLGAAIVRRPNGSASPA